MLNCLSFDIEGFVESNAQSFYIDEKYKNRKKEILEIEKNTATILELLSHFNHKATFFFLDSVVKDLPSLVKEVANEGHEIALHGPEHIRIFDLKKEHFEQSLIDAKKRLEDISGQKVIGFRAAEFSITDESIWALDILKKAEFVYDSSIYPFGFHDIYGIKEAQVEIHKLANGLIEFPLSTFQMFGKRLPFGGGGYFRLLPLAVTKKLIKVLNKNDIPFITYIHPYEVGDVIPEIPSLSAYRKFRHYYNCDNGYKRLYKLLSSFEFGTAQEILKNKNLL